MKDSSITDFESYPENTPFRRIVSVARRHFFAFGFRAVTMDDIARELGMSKKTLYAHFPRKTALVEAVLTDKVRSVDEDLSKIASESPDDFPTAISRLLTVVQKHLEEIRPPFLRDLQRDAPELFKIIETRRREMMHRYFDKLVVAGQSAGIIREDVSPRLIFEIFLASTQAIMNPEKLTDLDITPKDGFSAIAQVIFKGVVTDTWRTTL